MHSYLPQLEYEDTDVLEVCTWNTLDALGDVAVNSLNSTLVETDDDPNSSAIQEDDEEHEYLDSIPACQWNSCGIQFSQLKELVFHLAEDHIHRGSQKSDPIPWACEWVNCPRAGLPHSSRNALISHMRGHTGEKPFACTHCPRRFPRADAMQKHIKNHHHQQQTPLQMDTISTKKVKKESEKPPPAVPIEVNEGLAAFSTKELSEEKLEEIHNWLKATYHHGMPLLVVKQNEGIDLLQISYNRKLLTYEEKELLCRYYISMQERRQLMVELQRLHTKAQSLAVQITRCRASLGRS